jgi:hypothetical protein
MNTVAAIPAVSATATVAQVRKYIEQGSDGPLDAFVILSRAVRVALNSSLGDPSAASEETVANAIYESLADFGWLVRVTGDDRDGLIKVQA